MLCNPLISLVGSTGIELLPTSSAIPSTYNAGGVCIVAFVVANCRSTFLYREGGVSSGLRMCMHRTDRIVRPMSDDPIAVRRDRLVLDTETLWRIDRSDELFQQLYVLTTQLDTSEGPDSPPSQYSPIGLYPLEQRGVVDVLAPRLFEVEADHCVDLRSVNGATTSKELDRGNVFDAVFDPAGEVINLDLLHIAGVLSNGAGPT